MISSLTRRRPDSGSIRIRAALLIALAGALSAAANAFSQSFDTGQWNASFNRDISMSTWQAGIGSTFRTGTGTRISILEHFMTSMLNITNEENRWKDQNRLTLSVLQPVGRLWSLTADGGSYLFSDRQTGYVNDIRTGHFTVGASLNSSLFSMPLTAGIKEDQRFGRRDRGLTYRMGFDMPRLKWGDYTQQLAVQHEADNLNKRKNSGITAEYTVHRTFQNTSGDTLTAGISRQRRDYYISANGMIESRNTKSEYAENRLTYVISPDIQYRIRTSVSWRSLDINVIDDADRYLKRKRSDFTSDLGFIFIISRETFSGRIELTRRTEEQQYDFGQSGSSSPFSGSSLLVTPDNQARETRLALQGGWRPGRRDSLTFHGSIQKYQYDTPSALNVDDRDEIRIKFNLEELHRFSPALACRLRLSAHLLHFVYISGRRSADNNWTRVISFQPSLEWKPAPALKFSQTAEVMANYVSYDFEDMFPDVKSFLYRKFTLSDSLQYRFSQQAGLNVSYRLELDENGKFLIDQWAQQKLIDRTSHTFSVNVHLRPAAFLTVSPGYSFYIRKGYQYSPAAHSAGTRNLSMHFRSYGPGLNLEYQGRKLQLMLTGSRIVTAAGPASPRVLSRLDLNCRWQF